ncbi:MAG: FKBP-type peptidyl-prolyl cis-trans isomerase [Desulfobacterota bacterium]|jgi:FKBP-type peptidyl-prolyl cis-trans isomerase SlyD|nr:FKBP-type peptidyl-prolyl cis-trans isomerase [Thermodesulfobacteriota bacterium]
MDSVQIEKMVTVKYHMMTHLMDGSVKDHKEEGITFVYGVERQVPTLERALEGCHVGDQKNITIPSGEIYGEHDARLIAEIPKKGLLKQRLVPGQYYRQMKQGKLIAFKVLDILPRTVLVDFNDPLAGIEVSMDLEVTAIREASPEEIETARETQVKRRIGCA